MIRRSIQCLFLTFVIPVGHAFAGPYADTLGKKMVSSMTPTDKTVLIRWLFMAISTHPDVKGLTTITPEQRKEANKAFAELATRLLTVDCLTEAREAVRYEGPSSLGSAFQLLGQVAGREIFSNPNVTEGLSDLSKSVDVKAIEKALADPQPSEIPK